jgi:hypothetical protein
MTDIRYESGNLKERYYLGDIGVDGRMILKCFLKGIVCESVNWLMERFSGGCCEYGNEPLGFVNGVEPKTHILNHCVVFQMDSNSFSVFVTKCICLLPTKAMKHRVTSASALHGLHSNLSTLLSLLLNDLPIPLYTFIF